MHFRGGSVIVEVPVVFHMMAQVNPHHTVEVEVVAEVAFAMHSREESANAGIPVDFLMMVLVVIPMEVDILQHLADLEEELVTLFNVENAQEEILADFPMKMVG